jgi:hypothetical protein
MDDNPYAAPREVLRYEIQPGELNWSAVHVDRRWAYRRVELHGPLSAVIEYNGRGIGFESVLVDGEVAGRASGTWGFASPIEFVLPCKGSGRRARIEVRTAFFLFLGAFRLLVDDSVVYSEGRW